MSYASDFGIAVLATAQDKNLIRRLTKFESNILMALLVNPNSKEAVSIRGILDSNHPGVQIMRKRLDAALPGHKVDGDALRFLGVVATTPGEAVMISAAIAYMMTHEFRAKKLLSDEEPVNLLMVARYGFPDGIPTDAAWGDLWDMQKSEVGNKLDLMENWQ